LLSDWDKTLMAAGGLSLLALGIYSAKGFTGVTAKYVESRLGEYIKVIMKYLTFNNIMSLGFNIIEKYI